MTRPTVTSTIPRSIEDIPVASLTEAMRGTGTLHYSPTTSKVAPRPPPTPAWPTAMADTPPQEPNAPTGPLTLCAVFQRTAAIEPDAVALRTPGDTAARHQRPAQHLVLLAFTCRAMKRLRIH